MIVQILVQDALDVKKGTKILPTIQHAQILKQTTQEQKYNIEYEIDTYITTKCTRRY